METAGTKKFLRELFDQTEGDPERQVSMYEIGDALRMEKNEARVLAENLIMEEKVELVTLAGGIAITTDGLAFLGERGGADQGPVFSLSGKDVLDDGDKDTVLEIIGQLRQQMYKKPQDGLVLERFVVDLKTVEVQLLSPKPRRDVVVAVFVSLQEQMRQAGLTEMVTVLQPLCD